jgi:L-threonylcarbamoyladenylate synthase
MKPENIEILKRGGVGVIPTDTIYGLACSAFSVTAVERIYNLKGRDENKPLVIIISDISDLEKFGAKVSEEQLKFIKKYWPGKVTIIFEISKDFNYLDKGLGLAIRLPADENILEFLKQSGPLATSSANIQGKIPAKNIEEAQKYFGPSTSRAGDKVDFYEDAGELDSAPSTLVRISGDKVEVLREGVVKIL